MNKNKGFSLIELMVVVAIVGIIASMAVPAFMDMLERNRLKGAVQSLQDDLQWMRIQSIKQNCNLQASFDTAVWSYQIYQPAGRCGCAAGGANCVLQTTSGARFPGVSMGTPDFLSAPTTVAEFDFRRGEARRVNNNFSNGGVTLTTSNYSARVVVAQSGRVRICTPASTTGLPDKPAC